MEKGKYGIKVEDSYRTNPLSKTPGGSTICIANPRGGIPFEYDKIKSVYAYLRVVKRSHPDIKTWWYKEDSDKTYEVP